MRPCNQCGKCCLRYGAEGLSASAADLWKWEVFRPDIAAWVVDGEIWFDPVTGEAPDACPWLERLPTDDAAAPLRYGCSIYEDRPEDCRHYPTTLDEMVHDDCEMIEVRDLQQPREAQMELDRLMADSRPSVHRS